MVFELFFYCVTVQPKNCLMNLKNSGDSTGFEPMTSAMPCKEYRMNTHISFTGKHEPNKLTCSQLCDFVAQLVRALHRRRRGHRFESH